MDDLVDLPQTPALTARRTAPDHVADVLRDAILTGQLEEGQELNQVALAEHFKVSRVPVREALRQLQAEGLVRQEAHRRAVVSTLSAERIMELFDLRIRLETYLLERAAFHIDTAEAARLRAMIQRMESLDDHDEWLAGNREFHRALYEPSGATYTLELVDRIMARTTRYLYARSGGAGIHRVDEANEEHREIVRALEEHDVHRASRSLTFHIEGTRRRVDRLLRRAGRRMPSAAVAEGTA